MPVREGVWINVDVTFKKENRVCIIVDVVVASISQGFP
jgi:hypothetical protein